MIVNRWEILRCPGCGSPYDVGHEQLVCTGCDNCFPVVDGIPLLMKDTTRGTALEKIDYDAVHGITARAIATTGTQWKAIIDGLGRSAPPKHALEIGAGTGALTLGLLAQRAVQHLTATDVSHRFLRMLADRAAGSPTPVSFVACDANEPNFAPNTFDLVVGKSILHHLLDYDMTLRQCQAALEPGGVAVFFEPVLEGKTVLSMLMALVAGCDERAQEPQFSVEERARINRQIAHQIAPKVSPKDRASLAKVEDKYIFEVDRLTQVGRDAGFAEVEVFNNGRLATTYWPYLAQTFNVMGIPAERLRPYRWVGEEFARTYGLVFPEKLVTPMVYFVFRK